jgi:Protein phosphatase 2A regulatory B subunit (B56 family)
VNSTIHGMVYNALKLFMEVNPQLFDECSHEYSQQQSSIAEKQASRRQKWEKLEALAKSNKEMAAGGAPTNAVLPPAPLSAGPATPSAMPPLPPSAGSTATNVTGPVGAPPASNGATPAGTDGEEGDPRENQRRMEALRLQDDAGRSGGAPATSNGTGASTVSS